jgi:hypothetical protein
MLGDAFTLRPGARDGGQPRSELVAVNKSISPCSIGRRDRIGHMAWSRVFAHAKKDGGNFELWQSGDGRLMKHG